jgi:NAD(P)H-hydrate repair Nnr-like enzyme with NAD(P)H-hydrate epimerase domain
MTGLDGYFSSKTYSISFAVAGLGGSNAADALAKAEHLYERRRGDVTSFVKGDLSDAASARLAQDHVRWIVVSGDALQSISSSVTPWRKTREMAVYRFSR